MSTLFAVSEDWRRYYPGACVGFLTLREVTNPSHHPELERAKRDLELTLRQRWAGQDRRALDGHGVLPAYAAYYRRFKKTYHVQGQLESVAFKDKPIPTVAVLVEAMFMAELKNLVLTAGHDSDTLNWPITVGVANGSETLTTLRGQEQTLKPADMFMADMNGVLSSIVNGLDRRCQITEHTRRVVYAAYAPEGVSETVVSAHLSDIRDLVRLVSPDALADLTVIPAGAIA